MKKGTLIAIAAVVGAILFIALVRSGGPGKGPPAPDPNRPPPPIEPPVDTRPMPDASLSGLASKVAMEFVGHVWDGRYPAAYAMMTESYRKKTPIDAFQKACAASPALTAKSSVFVNGMEEELPTIRIKMAVLASPDPIPLEITFLVEKDRFAVASVAAAGTTALGKK